MSLDYIHRTAGEAEIYFVANRRPRAAQCDCTFRVAGRQPELWDAVTGRIRPAAAFQQSRGRTTVPLEFGPHGSLFVVFREPVAPTATGAASRNFPVFTNAQEITGGWTVRFDPKWGGPESAEFDRLISWTRRPEAGIRHYSGKATYLQTFDLPEVFREPGREIVLDLGAVKNLAAVRLNGRSLGVVWTAPFRLDITAAVHPRGNRLEIDVVNLWPNRLIGDAALPPQQQLTRGNVKLAKDQPLLESGLLGPVTLQVAEHQTPRNP